MVSATNNKKGPSSKELKERAQKLADEQATEEEAKKYPPGWRTFTVVRGYATFFTGVAFAAAVIHGAQWYFGDEKIREFVNGMLGRNEAVAA